MYRVRHEFLTTTRLTCALCPVCPRFAPLCGSLVRTKRVSLYVESFVNTTPPSPQPSMTRGARVGMMDDAALAAGVEALLDDATPEPSVGAGGGATVGGMPNPMVALASAMLEAQGPRPTFADFANVPRSNPFESTQQHVYVTRHGARIDNGPDSDPLWHSKGGHHLSSDDPYLSPSGFVAAEELAARLSVEAAGIVHVVSSPYVRCIQTADAVAARFGVGIKVEPGISEVGAWAHTLLPPTELANRFPRIDTSYTPVLERTALTEEHSDGQAARRAFAAARAVRERLDGPVLLVGHGASCLGLVQAFGGSGYVGYTSLTRFRREAGGGEWALVGELGDVSHLSDQQTARGSAW